MKYVGDDEFSVVSFWWYAPLGIRNLELTISWVFWGSALIFINSVWVDRRKKYLAVLVLSVCNVTLKGFSSSQQVSFLQHCFFQTAVPHLWDFFNLYFNYANILSSCYQMAALFCCVVVPWSKNNILFIKQI